MSLGKYNFHTLFFYSTLFFFLFSCQKKEKTYFETIALNDVKLTSPKYGSWRYNNDEKFQKFEDFQKEKKINPEPGKNTIYLQPIGQFDALQTKEIQLTREYLKIYFQLETKVLPVLPNNLFPKTVRRISKEGQEQVLASYVLDSILIGRKPKDAVVLMGSQKKIFSPDLNGTMFSDTPLMKTV